MKNILVILLLGLATNSFAQMLSPNEIKSFIDSDYATISSTLNSSGFKLKANSSGYRAFKKSAWEAIKGYYYYLFLKDNSEGIAILFDQDKSKVIKIMYRIPFNSNYNNKFYSYFSNYAYEKSLDDNSKLAHPIK